MKRINPQELVTMFANRDSFTRTLIIRIIDLIVILSEAVLLTRVQLAMYIAGDLVAVFAAFTAFILCGSMASMIEKMFTKLRQTVQSGTQHERFFIAAIPYLLASIAGANIVAGVLPAWLFWLSELGILSTAGIAALLFSITKEPGQGSL